MESGTGYRFHPTEDELINHYLKLKMLGYDDEVSIIPQVNVLDYEPWQLPQMSTIPNNSEDQVWYFFCEPSKYAKSQRAKRTTRGGFWKVTGKDQKIKDIAIKKRMVFHQGRFPGVRTNWIMHEYNPTFNFKTKRNFVLCKLKKRPDDDDEEDEGQSSNTNMGMAFNNATEEENQFQAHLTSFRGYNKSDYDLNYAMPWGS